jgi:hypothetical protein
MATGRTFKSRKDGQMYSKLSEQELVFVLKKNWLEARSFEDGDFKYDVDFRFTRGQFHHSWQIMKAAGDRIYLRHEIFGEISYDEDKGYYVHSTGDEFIDLGGLDGAYMQEDECLYLIGLKKKETV